jgi:VanZ family protein
MKLNQGFIKYWVPVIIWMAFIFWMSTETFSSEQTSRFIGPILYCLFPWLSSQDVDLIHGLIRKSGHIVEYFVLGLLLFRAFRADSLQKWCFQWTLCVIIGVVLFALCDEFHQSFFSSRTSSLVDVGIDSAGGVLSQIAILMRPGSNFF